MRRWPPPKVPTVDENRPSTSRVDFQLIVAPAGPFTSEGLRCDTEPGGVIEPVEGAPDAAPFAAAIDGHLRDAQPAGEGVREYSRSTGSTRAGAECRDVPTVKGDGRCPRASRGFHRRMDHIVRNVTARTIVAEDAAPRCPVNDSMPAPVVDRAFARPVCRGQQASFADGWRSHPPLSQSRRLRGRCASHAYAGEHREAFEPVAAGDLLAFAPGPPDVADRYLVGADPPA